MVSLYFFEQSNLKEHSHKVRLADVLLLMPRRHNEDGLELIPELEFVLEIAFFLPWRA